MCTLYRIQASTADIAALFDATPGATPDPPAEIYPRRAAPVVRATESGRIVEAMTWGFPPPANSRAPVVNVRNLESPFWRTALATPGRRCLVPVSLFCEWEGEVGAKVKRWFHLPARPVFAFAGVWRPTETGAAFAFLTCEPNPLVAPIHPKAMPVILHDADHETWLNADLATAKALAVPFPSQLMALAGEEIGATDGNGSVLSRNAGSSRFG